MELRHASVDDLPAILALWSQQALPDGESLAPFITRRGCTYVVLESRHLVGFVCVSRLDARIAALCVSPNYRGCGVGRALLLRATQYLSWLGIRSARLCPAPNTQGFYRAQGWQPSGSDSSLWQRRLG